MVVSRDVDKLDPLPNAKLQQLDQQYLEKHGLNKLFGDLLTGLIEEQPLDPLQYMIDTVEYNRDYAKQDKATGLPQHRYSKLQDVFRIMDQEGHGKISFASLQKYAAKYGGTPLGTAELKSIFNDFHPGEDNLITLQEFLVYFSKVSRTITNTAFDALVKELMA